MKRTCRRCSALETSGPWLARCGLGYPVSLEIFPCKPLVDCPKPLTNREWLASPRFQPTPHQADTNISVEEEDQDITRKSL